MGGLTALETVQQGRRQKERTATKEETMIGEESRAPKEVDKKKPSNQRNYQRNAELHSLGGKRLKRHRTETRW